MERTNTTIGTWIAGAAVCVTLLGSLLAYNSAQTTLANSQAALALEVKRVHEDVLKSMDSRIFTVNDRITRFEEESHETREDIEARMRVMVERHHATDIRAEKNETLLKLVTEGKLP